MPEVDLYKQDDFFLFKKNSTVLENSDESINLTVCVDICFFFFFKLN